MHDIEQKYASLGIKFDDNSICEDPNEYARKFQICSVLKSSPIEYLTSVGGLETSDLHLRGVVSEIPKNIR